MLTKYVSLCTDIYPHQIKTLSGTDSADFFLQKVKPTGKTVAVESLKNFEKAAHYDANNKVITTELASAYLDLRKYHQAIEMYKKLISLGETSAANYSANASFIPVETE